MEIEFDDAKDAANIAKHGVSLALGAVVLENRLVDVRDVRHASEERRNAFGRVEGRLFACTYTVRARVHRIISVRPAHEKELRKWLSLR
jgi:uncharacterized DUF497 family protein